jgi:tmRNA-binding protein
LSDFVKRVSVRKETITSSFMQWKSSEIWLNNLIISE